MKDVTPLFVIHSGNTGSDVYRPLFNNIDCDKYPIYVIEPHNLLRINEERITGIDNIARYYIDLVKNFKPEYGLNNIRLMGWSYGGVVASEMAYQLANEGIINVEQLLVLDSPFYLNENDMKQAKEREENGYYRKYFETEHIFKDMKSKNVSVEKLIQNNHEAFQDLYSYVPKKIQNIPTKYIRSVVEEKPLSDRQLSTLFGNLEIYDVLSKHDYLFVDEQTRIKLQEILEIRKLEKNDVKNISIS